jgi:hypothetical protein
MEDAQHRPATGRPLPLLPAANEAGHPPVVVVWQDVTIPVAPCCRAAFSYVTGVVNITIQFNDLAILPPQGHRPADTLLHDLEGTLVPVFC